MKLKAKWIWKKQRDYKKYNQAIIARKQFRLGEIKQATIRITADSYYRLYINGAWVSDGPCRSWPEHFQYDQINVSSYLNRGDNEIKVIGRHYGIGDFHCVPQQAGLLVQLDVKLRNGKAATVISDGSWEVADVKGWVSNTTKISIQMEPAEYYDARLEGKDRFTRAAVLFDADGGPWKGLNRRDVALMTKKPFSFKSFAGAKIVKAEGINYHIPTVQLVHPGMMKANRNTGSPMGIATILKVKEKCSVQMEVASFRDEDLKIAIDGKHNPNGQYNLSSGNHLALAFTRNGFDHGRGVTLRVHKPKNVKMANPLESGHENPWCFVDFKEFAFSRDDMDWKWFFEANPGVRKMVDEYEKITNGYLKKITDKKTFIAAVGGRSRCMASEKMCTLDSHWKFEHRQVVAGAAALVDNPGGLMYDNGEFTVVRPSREGDVELCYDFE